MKTLDELIDLHPILQNVVCGVEVPDGWVAVIHDLATKLEKVCPNLVVTQVKTKFGHLRFYYDNWDLRESLTEEIDRLIEEAEQATYLSCDACGQAISKEVADRRVWGPALCQAHLIRFEAVILRFMPDAGSGECFNVGLAMRSTEGGSGFNIQFTEDLTCLEQAFPGLHCPTVKTFLGQVSEEARRVYGEEPQALDTLLARIVPDRNGSLSWSTTPLLGVARALDLNQTFKGIFERYVSKSRESGAAAP
jgi:hypothetical protein